MSEYERTLFIGNYKVPKNKLASVLQEKFGPCLVKDPMQPKSGGMHPFGFVIFESEANARACLAARKLNIDGEEMIISTATRKTIKGPGSTASNTFQFGGSLSNGTATRPASSGQGSHLGNQEQPKKIKVILSHSNGLDELYIQDLSGTRAVEYLSLQEDLANHCKTAVSVSSPNRGKMYAALFSEDGAWYRCTVIDKNSAGLYIVQFVDYGNQSTVKCEEIKELTPALMSKDPAAHKYHIKDLVAKASSVDNVKQLLMQWHEVLLECEVAADGSIDLKCQGKSLRSALINSGFVTISELLDDDSSSETSKSGKRSRNKKSGANQSMEAGDAGAQSQTVDKAALQQMQKLNSENVRLKEQLKKMTQLADRKSIDSLNSELASKLVSLRTLRPKFSMAADGALNHAITLLADAAYTKDIHEETFNPVFTTYTEYTNQQNLIRQLKPSVDTLDNSTIEQRNEARTAFCDAVKVCQQKCKELKVMERRSQLNDILVKLADFHPDLSSEPFEGDIEQTVANFTQWQENEGEKIHEVQLATENALSMLSRQLQILQQNINLDVEVASEGDIQLEEATKSAISALDGELAAIDMSEGNSRFEVIRQTCCALQSKISEEFNLLDDMHNELSKLQKQAASLEPYFGVTEPQNLQCMQKKEKKLKELRSQLRHRIADLDDLRENDEESDTDISDMEQQVEETRSQIQSVLVELEKYIDDLVYLCNTVFPEFAIRYPKFCLDKSSESYIKPLRDVTFYKDDGTTLTTFNGKAVVVKTVHAPAGTTNCVPDIVKQILSQSALSRYISIDAVFFSKNGTNTYVQMSSDFEDITSYLHNTAVIELDSLTEAIANVCVTFSPSTGGVTDDATDETSELTSGSETNVEA